MRLPLTALLLAATALAGCAQDTPEAKSDEPGFVPHANTVGTIPYDGPTTATGLQAHCGGGGYDSLECYVETLEAYLQNAGSKPAFSLLAELTHVDSAANSQSHAIAHELGNYALKVYGDIQLTLDECSYELFQGCLHGAMQAYFDSLGELRPEHYLDLCPNGYDFPTYACVHGLGHGFMLSTRYDLNQTLGMCDNLQTDYARGSCHGGSFHENLVGYFDREHPVEGVGHVHGDTSDVQFMIRKDDPYFPCNVVDSRYQDTCWLLQTSIMLLHNGADFADAARLCAEEPTGHSTSCYSSLGRDASAHANGECGARATACYAQGVERRCAAAPPEGRSMCVRGAIAEVILNFAMPAPGLKTCQLVQDASVKPGCYEEVGSQAMRMVDAATVAALCDQAETDYRDDCRRGGRVP